MLSQLTVGKLPLRPLLGQGTQAAKLEAWWLKALQRRQWVVDLDLTALGEPGALGSGCLEARVEP